MKNEIIIIINKEFGFQIKCKCKVIKPKLALRFSNKEIQ